MRTSGAATEIRLIFAIGVVALGVALLLAGGPRNLMIVFENALRAAAKAIYQGWLSFRA
jgi:hypothetical protein